MSVDIAYITIEEALHIHQMTISHSGGGSYTLLNEGMVDSILATFKTMITIQNF